LSGAAASANWASTPSEVPNAMIFNVIFSLLVQTKAS
jgi:hypothetical protein